MRNKLSAHITPFPIMILVIMTLIIPVCLNTKIHAQTQPTVSIEPQSTSALINEVFSVNLTIADVTDLCSWQAYIYYQNDILQVVGYEEGPFLKSHGSTIFDAGYNNNYNETHGEIWMYCIRTWSGTGVNGSGVLATINFKAIGGGTTILHLTDTILGNSTAQPIPHTTQDGQVNVLGGDIAILNLEISKTIIGQGYPANITITVENQGVIAETFNLTLYANTTEIETKEIMLESNANLIVTFTWNTTHFAKGNYNIWAYAEPVPSEIDTTDNLLTDGIVTVTIPGDVNGEGTVDIYDLITVAAAYGFTPSSSNWDPNADINGDNIIDIYDLIGVATNFGKTDP